MANQAWSWSRVAVISVLWLLYVVISTPVQLIGLEGALTILGYALVGLVVATIAGTVLFLGLRNLLNPTSRPAVISVRAVSVGVASAVAGVVVILLSDTGAYAATLSPTVFVVVPAFAAPVCLFGFDVIAESRAETLARREQLVREAADLLATSTSQTAIVADIRASIMTAVDQELAPVRTQVARQLDLLNAQSPNAFGGSSSLHDAAHDSVRPLIEQLSSTGIASPEPLGVFGSVRAIIRTQPFRPLVLSVIFVIAATPLIVVDEAPEQVAISTTLGVALIFLILGVANRAMRTWPRHHASIFITGFVVLQIPTVIDIAARGRGVVETLVTSLASVLAGAVVVLLTSGLTSWRDRQEEAQQTFRELLDHERIESLARSRIAAEVAREAAQNLHGPVQARLAACAVAMELASQTGDTNAYRAALFQAQAALAIPIFDPPTTDISLPELLQEVADPWRGLVSVVVDVPDLDLPPTTRTIVEKIVEEALTNAVRHGAARHVHVEVRDADGLVTVQIDDDGRGPTFGGAGLGTAYLDRMTNGQWQLESSPLLHGARLRALVLAG